MKKLILFGDSLLAGYIDGHATNIVTQGLQEKLPNFTIINNSVPGSTTEMPRGSVVAVGSNVRLLEYRTMQ